MEHKILNVVSPTNFEIRTAYPTRLLAGQIRYHSST